MVSLAKGPWVVILLVEDDPGDQMITQEAFRSLSVPYELQIVSDGKEALDYLYHQGSYVSAPDPDLILLDLNMPRVTGQEVARRLHADPLLHRIPVVVLTTSRREEDVLRAYGQGVSCFFRKPLNFEDFIATLHDMERLLKYVLGLKTLRHRARVTDRQLRRTAHRARQIKRLTDEFFEDRMKEIQSVLHVTDEVAAPETSEIALAHSSVEAGLRQSLLKLARKLLDGRAEMPIEDAPEAHPCQHKKTWDGAPQVSAGLSQLARRLDELEASSGSAVALSVTRV